jgi:hypothetical protein
MSFNFNIPIPLLETLQSSFEREGKKLAESVAISLGLQPQEVIKKVFKKTKITVFDWDAPPSCDVLRKDNLVYAQCAKPCLLGTTKCLIHQQEIVIRPVLKKVQRLIVDDRRLWLDEESKVYSSDGDYLGWLKNGELYLIDFECN